MICLPVWQVGTGGEERREISKEREGRGGGDGEGKEREGGDGGDGEGKERGGGGGGEGDGQERGEIGEMKMQQDYA